MVKLAMYVNSLFQAWFSDKKEIEVDNIETFEAISGENIHIGFDENKKIMMIRIENKNG